MTNTGFDLTLYLLIAIKPSKSGLSPSTHDRMHQNSFASANLFTSIELKLKNCTERLRADDVNVILIVILAKHHTQCFQWHRPLTATRRDNCIRLDSVAHN